MLLGILMVFAVIISVITPILAAIDFGCFLIDGKRGLPNKLVKFLEIFSIGIFPCLFLMSEYEVKNDCCSESAVFASGYKTPIYFIVITCAANYFYCSNRRLLAAPLTELLINSLLLIGISFNVFMAIQLKSLIWLVGNFPVILLFLTMIHVNHNKILAELETFNTNELNKVQSFCLRLLRANIFLKYPVFLVLTVPILVLVAALLLIFGQKPDAIIKAFTETYKHGFSQLDYMCDNVNCGDHYLCSVAANGHPAIVKPVRYGERNGGRIICNRQLLISNAFEELLEEKYPAAHRVMRKNYDRVGDVVHKNYKVFNNKFFSDFIYIVMKPLEWIFLLVLYLFVRKPENRIAKQYINKARIQEAKKFFFDPTL